jgi:hypothetical protein
VVLLENFITRAENFDKKRKRFAQEQNSNVTVEQIIARYYRFIGGYATAEAGNATLFSCVPRENLVKVVIGAPTFSSKKRFRMEVLFNAEIWPLLFTS